MVTMLHETRKASLGRVAIAPGIRHRLDNKNL